MSISRRQFIRTTSLGAVAFSATTSAGILFPKPAEGAIFLGLLLRTLSARSAFAGIMLHSAGRRVPLFGGLSEEEKVQIQLADQEYIERAFTSAQTEVARIPESIYRGYERADAWGPNVGFAFTQRFNSTIGRSKVSGPTMAAIYKVAERMGKTGFSPRLITDCLFPLRSGFDDWCTWEGDSFSGARTRGVCFANYQTVLGEVTSRYDLVQPGRGGQGNVHLAIEAGGEPRRNFTIQVKF